ncbi:MAG: ATP-grasp domain-containing protein [Nitrospiraceae bacterium]|nr:ATP-grasp domain-containing protein [Nitrospiraceae bacterium]
MTGDMPTLCDSSVSSPDSLKLLTDAGLALPEKIISYSSSKEYLDTLRDIYTSGQKLALQYIHLESEVPADRYWVHPEKISFLNNKANIEKLVEQAYLPKRKILKSSKPNFKKLVSELPAVIKSVTNESSGTGTDVMICRNFEQLSYAENLFSTCSHFVCEEYLDIVRNLCLNYAVTASGEIKYLGCAEQISDSYGKYHGNWIDSKIIVPESAVKTGLEIAREGMLIGYWGFVGIDMAVLENGDIKVFDLNFRVNGSTRALLLADSILRTHGKQVIRLRTWKKINLSYRDLLNLIYKAMHKNILMPLCSYDPEVCGNDGASPRLTGMLLGSSRDEVIDIEKELAYLGLE